MPDRETVKQGIKCHLVSKSCAGCPYEAHGARAASMPCFRTSLSFWSWMNDWRMI